MRKFPVSEAETVALANEIAIGLEANMTLFAAPPVPFEDIRSAVVDYIGARDAMVLTKAASKTATVGKNEAYEALIGKMKQVIRYAENLTDYRDDQLNLIGWSGRRESTSVEAPGNPPLLTVTGEGPGSISFSWSRPVTGGKPLSYLVERREQGTDTWNLTEVSAERSITLTGQPRGQSLEYRVVSMNRAGSSEGSNTVSVVL